MPHSFWSRALQRLASLACILLLTTAAQATAPSDEAFESYSTDGATVATPRNFGGFVLTADGGATSFVTDKAVFGLTLGTGKVVVVNADDSTSGTYVEFHSSSLSDNFQLVSLEIESFSGGWSDTYTVTGYNGGSSTTAVASDTIDLSVSDSTGSITYVKTSGAVGGTLTFDATWGNIDTLRFTKTSGSGPKLAFDTINISPAWLRRPIYTIAGNPVASGTATNVGQGANGVAVAANGDVYVADATNHTIRKIDHTSGLSTVVAGTGSSGFTGDGGAATSAKLNSPRGVFVDTSGNIFIADTNNHRIRQIDTNGLISTIAGTGTGTFGGDSGAATSAKVNSPQGVFVDTSGNIFIADTSNNRIRKINTSGTITTVAGNGTGGYLADNVSATGTRINAPRGVCTDSSGNLYIADTNNNRIRKVSTGGTITTVVGTGTASYSGDGGSATTATIRSPQGIAIDASGNLYISDTNNQRIRKVTSGVISTIAGTGTNGYNGDGIPATTATISIPVGIAVDSSGNVYVGESGVNRVRKIDTSGTISTYAGTGNAYFGGDGGLATNAQFSSPNGVAYDSSGNVYLADSSTHRIRKIDTSGVVTEYAGTGNAGYSGDGGAASSAQLNTPLGIAIDSSGNLYIADGNNNRVRKVDTAGVITTVAGNGVGSFSGDNGPATSASLFGIFGVAVFDGSLYIADTGNNRIRKVDSSGTITTIAGNGTSGYSGDSGAATSAKLSTPIGITVDSLGNVYFTDYGNNVVRKIDTSGIITTVAGSYISGYTGDNGPATSARLNYPRGIAVDTSGNLFISDTSNGRIRRVDTTGTIFTLAGTTTTGFSGDAGYSEDAQVAFPTAISISSSGLLAVADNSNRRFRQIGYRAPSVTSALTASGTYGTAFSYAITGTNFPTSYGATGLPSSLTLDTSTGIISGTPTKADLTGSPYSVTLSVTNLGGTAQATLVLTLNKATIGLTGATASRVYDGTTSAAGNLDFSGASLTGKVGSDSVSIDTTSATGSFGTSAVGTGKTVTVSNLSLTGSDSYAYQLDTVTATGTITAKPLTLTGLTADKVYDGTTTATLSGTGALASSEAAGTGTTTDGAPYTGDTVLLTGTATGASFSTRAVGSGKTVTVTGLALTGADSGNYTLTPTFTAEITAKALTVSGLSGVDKVYDGTTAATLSGTGVLLSSETIGNGSVSDGRAYSLDDVSLSGSPTAVFADKNVATGISLSVSGYSLSGNDAGNYSLTSPSSLTAGISAKTLSLAGVTAADKVYDATASATLSGTPTLQSSETPGAGTTVDGKPYTGDTLSLSGTTSGTFADANVGTAKTVTVTGISLGGAQAGNYALGTLTTTATISVKALSVSGLSGVNKIYDGTVAASLSGAAALLSTEAAGAGTSTDGKPFATDTVTLTGTAAAVFAERQVGTSKPLTISGLSLSGAQAGNYEVTLPINLTADITAKALTVNGISGVDRVYDGTTTATLSGTPALLSSETAGAGTTSDGAPYAIDTVSLSGTAAGTFSTRHVGTTKAVTISGLSLSGADAGNYTVSTPTGVTASITEKSLSISGIAGVDKIYDGTTAATLSGTAALLSTESAGSGSVNDGKAYSLDSVSLTGTPTAVFSGKNVADSISVSVTGYALTGAEASNYTLTSPSGLTASIFAKSLTVGGVTAADKVYDATVTASLSGTPALQAAESTGTGTSLDGKPYVGDTVSLSGTVSGTFSDANVGTTKTITLTGVSLTGAQAGNYELGALSTTAAITAKSLSVSGLSGVNKIYDGSTSATLSGTPALLATEVAGTGTTTDGKPFTGDTVSVSGTATAVFADRHVGTGKSLTISGLTLSGAHAGNYQVTQPTSLTADITVKALTVDGLSASNKTYDGTTTAALSGTPTLLSSETAGTGTTSDGAPYSGDAVSASGTPVGTFDTRHVGPAKAITVTGLSLSGAEAGNYSITQPTGLTAEVTVKTLLVSGLTGVDKIYDGTATASLSGVAALLSSEAAGTGATNDGRPYSGDDISAAGSGTGFFADRHAGVSKPVTVSGFTLTGAEAGNYTVQQPAGLSAAISAKEISVSGLSASNRTYDATASAALTGTATLHDAETAGTGTTSDGKPYNNDSVVVTGSPVGAFADKNVASNKPVTVTGLSLDGTHAGNYTLVAPQGLTASISAKALVVTGLTIVDKDYDGTNHASLSGTATLLASETAGSGSAGDGKPFTGDTIGIAGSPTATFGDAEVGTSKAVTIVGLSLSGADLANYTLTAPSGSGKISPAHVTITLSQLEQTYDGSPKAVSVSVTPSMAATVTYDGASTAPTNAGSYNVVAQVDGNYTGTASGTLVIAKASQTLTFPTAAPASSIVLSATANTGLPVTYSVVSGNGSINENTLTITGRNAVVVRATQAGNENYLEATAEQTFSGRTLQTQTITFNAPGDQALGSAPVLLHATASSGLPVSFAVVSGPATMSSDSSVTLTGEGSVTVRASQAGNDDYEPAPAVNQTFEVSQPHIYFGAMNPSGQGDQKAGDVAGYLPPSSTHGILLLVIPGAQVNAVVEFELQEDGRFSATLELPATVGTGRPPGLLSASASRTLVITGTVANGVLAGQVDTLNLVFAANLVAPTGTTSSLAGVYTSNGTNTAAGTVTSIVGTEGQLLVVATTPTLSTGGAGTVSVSGTFSLTNSDATISGSIDGPSTTISGSISVTEGTPVTFYGTNTLSVRANRLINLSSRAQVGANENILIAGFVIAGTQPKAVLLRGVGPTLSEFGLQGVLTQPRLRLFNNAHELVAENAGWSAAENAAAISTAISNTGAFTLPGGSSDAAILETLAPGAYTLQISGDGGTGVALAELYDASEATPGTPPYLVNISTRGRVAGGEAALIGGFVVTGNTPVRVLVRGVGPALTQFGLTDVLSDPKLLLYSSTSTIVAENDNWQTATPLDSNQQVGTESELLQTGQTVGAFALTAGSKDAALLITLAPGSYTAQVEGVNNSTGVALVEVYRVP